MPTLCVGDTCTIKFWEPAQVGNPNPGKRSWSVNTDDTLQCTPGTGLGVKLPTTSDTRPTGSQPVSKDSAGRLIIPTGTTGAALQATATASGWTALQPVASVGGIPVVPPDHTTTVVHAPLPSLALNQTGLVAGAWTKAGADVTVTLVNNTTRRMRTKTMWRKPYTVLGVYPAPVFFDAYCGASWVQGLGPAPANPVADLIDGFARSGVHNGVNQGARHEWSTSELTSGPGVLNPTGQSSATIARVYLSNSVPANMDLLFYLGAVEIQGWTQ